MDVKNNFIILGFIFFLSFLPSCSRKTMKTQEASSTKTAMSTFEFTNYVNTIKAGDSFQFSVRGGNHPLKFSTTFGSINSSGLYRSYQYEGSGWVIVTDVTNNKIFTPIRVYTPLSVNPTSVTLVVNKNFKFKASGGFPPYSFTSNIGSIDSKTGDYVSPSTIGAEIITVTDNAGTKVTSFVTINPKLEINPPEIKLAKGGAFTFSISGGVPPFSFSTNFGNINSSGVYYPPNSDGTGMVTVMDGFGNKSVANVSLISGLGIKPSRINLSINSTYPFSATGGTPPYSFSVSMGNINNSGNYTAPSKPGPVTITVSDSTGNSQIADINIFEIPQISPTEKTLAVGNSFQFSASKGIPPFRYTSNIGTIDPASGYFTAPSNPASGKVSVFDQENNEASAIVNIKAQLSLSPQTLKLAVNDNFQFIASEGAPPYTFNALTGSITGNGVYSAPSSTGGDNVTVTDSVGNKAISNVTIISKLEISETTKTMRPGEYFTFEPKGGVPPYSFSAIYGNIDSLGLYKFVEGIDGDEVGIIDSSGEKITVKIIGDFSNLWVWMKGNENVNSPAIYGNEGEEPTTYNPGGKIGSVSFADPLGNLWIFGGANGPNNYFNELWVYDRKYNQWIWTNPNVYLNQSGIYGEMGKESSENVPGGRYFASGWADNKGNLWLFGGGAYGGAPNTTSVGLNDLWKYDALSSLWTWISGSNSPNNAGVYGTFRVASTPNTPGARHSASSWIDKNGNLWLFGGFKKPGASPNNLNDLWKFDPTSKQWAWMSGYNSTNQKGVYGTKGVENNSNVPGARQNAMGWTDISGNLWLFGGWGFSSANTGYLNDLWKFNLTTNRWTWIGGSNLANQAGQFGNKGEASANNVPSARQSAVAWADNKGNFWLFGGLEKFSSPNSYLNDLWKYDPATNQWTWMGGGNLPNQIGNYGKMGVSTINNIPGGRNSGVGWSDPDGNLWLFGGYGYGPTFGSGYLMDLWKFILK